jgi:hypothetical protein
MYEAAHEMRKWVTSITLILILMALIELINTVNDKGINMHLYQKIKTEHCAWDVETSKGTIINMNSPISMPGEKKQDG